jgi:hypothetical protein
MKAQCLQIINIPSDKKDLENGMDVKILSAMIGHVSAATILNIYSHVTDTMQV